MTKAKRPSLSKIMSSPARETPASLPGEPLDGYSTPPLFEAKKAKTAVAQLNVRVPADIQRRAKLKAIREGRSLQDVVVSLLTEWAK